MNRSHSGYTLVEMTVVLGIMTVLAAIAWPLTADLVAGAELATAAEMIRTDIRRAQREARVSGRTLVMRVDPASGAYTIGPLGGPGRLNRLSQGLAFTSTDGSDPDGVTFRDNTARFSPRPGLQSSLGSITVQSRRGAKRVTVSLTGHASITTWDGRQWR